MTIASSSPAEPCNTFKMGLCTNSFEVADGTFNFATTSCMEAEKELNLDNRIQSLPKELQLWIKDLLIATDLPCSLTSINNAWKPPLGLQIDHKTREQFAKEYYKNAVFHSQKIAGPEEFVIAFDNVIIGRQLLMIEASFRDLSRWLGSLTETHRKLVETVQLDVVGRQQAMREQMPLHVARREFEECCKIYWGQLGKESLIFEREPSMFSIRGRVLQADGTVGDVISRSNP